MSQRDREAAGFALVTLLYQRSDWILRRIEQLTFDDALVVRRRTFLDLTLERYENLDSDVLPLWGERLLLPLMLVSRSTYDDIRIEDARGESLPFLPRSDERRFVAAGLARISMEISPHSAKADDVELGYRTWRILSIIDCPPSEGEAFVKQLLNAPADQDPALYAIRDYLLDFVSNHVVIAAPHADALVRIDGTQWRARGLLRLCESHAEAYTSVDPDIFKVDRVIDLIDDCHRFTQSYAGHTLDGKAKTHLWELPKQIDDYRLTIPILQMQGAESVHVELVCPPGVYVDDSVLVAVANRAGPELVLTEISDDDCHWDSAHFHYSWRVPYGVDSRTRTSSGAPRPDVSISIESVLLVVLRPMFHGVLHAGRNVSILSALLLATLTATLGWQSAGWDPLVSIPLRTNGHADSIVALLLLAPTAALGLLIRENEHVLVKHVSRPYRERLGVTAAAIFAASGAIAIGLGGRLLFAILLVATLIVLGAALITLESARRSERRVKFSPVEPDWYPVGNAHLAD